jgi:hypothetical protein
MDKSGDVPKSYMYIIVMVYRMKPSVFLKNNNCIPIWRLHFCTTDHGSVHLPRYFHNNSFRNKNWVYHHFNSVSNFKKSHGTSFFVLFKKKIIFVVIGTWVLERWIYSTNTHLWTSRYHVNSCKVPMTSVKINSSVKWKYSVSFPKIS